MQVIGMLMGIPKEDQRTIRDYVDGYLRTEPGKPMKFQKGAKWSAGSKLNAIFGEYTDWRAKHPSDDRSEEHTSELQSLMRISYAVFCLKKKKKQIKHKNQQRYE